MVEVLQPKPTESLTIDDFSKIGIEGFDPDNRANAIAKLPPESQEKVNNDPSCLPQEIIENSLPTIRPDLKIDPRELTLAFEKATQPFSKERWFISPGYPIEKAILAWLPQYNNTESQPEAPATPQPNSIKLPEHTPSLNQPEQTDHLTTDQEPSILEPIVKSKEDSRIDQEINTLMASIQQQAQALVSNEINVKGAFPVSLKRQAEELKKTAQSLDELLTKYTQSPSEDFKKTSATILEKIRTIAANASVSKGEFPISTNRNLQDLNAAITQFKTLHEESEIAIPANVPPSPTPQHNAPQGAITPEKQAPSTSSDTEPLTKVEGLKKQILQILYGTETRPQDETPWVKQLIDYSFRSLDTDGVESDSYIAVVRNLTEALDNIGTDSRKKAQLIDLLLNSNTLEDNDIRQRAASKIGIELAIETTSPKESPEDEGQRKRLEAAKLPMDFTKNPYPVLDISADPGKQSEKYQEIRKQYLSDIEQIDPELKKTITFVFLPYKIHDIKNPEKRLEAFRLSLYAEKARLDLASDDATHIMRLALVAHLDFVKGERLDIINTCLFDENISKSLFSWFIAARDIKLDKDTQAFEILTEEEHKAIDMEKVSARGIALCARSIDEYLSGISRNPDTLKLVIEVAEDYGWFNTVWQQLPDNTKEQLSKMEGVLPKGYLYDSSAQNTDDAPVASKHSASEEPPVEQKKEELTVPVPDQESTAEKITRLININHEELTLEQSEEYFLPIYSRAKELIKDNDAVESIDDFIGLWDTTLETQIDNSQSPETKARLFELYVDCFLYLRHDYGWWRIAENAAGLNAAQLPLKPEHGNFLYEKIYEKLLERQEHFDFHGPYSPAFILSSIIVGNIEKILSPKENTTPIRKEWLGRAGQALNALHNNLAARQAPPEDFMSFTEYFRAFAKDHPKESPALYKTLNPQVQALLKQNGLAPQGLLGAVFTRIRGY